MINAETCWNRGIVGGLGVIFFLHFFFLFFFFLSFILGCTGLLIHVFLWGFVADEFCWWWCIC